MHENVHCCLKGNLDALLDCHLLDLGNHLIIAMLLDIISLGLEKAALDGQLRRHPLGGSGRSPKVKSLVSLIDLGLW